MCKICDDYIGREGCVQIGITGCDVGDFMDVFELDAWMIDDKLQFSLIIGDTDVKSLDIPIKYCPFCGKELPSIEES